MNSKLIPLYYRTDVEDVWKYNNGWPASCLTTDNFIKHGDAKLNLGLPGIDFDVVFRDYDPDLDQKYFYTMLISLMVNDDLIEKIEIESKVVDDVRAGRCKILITNMFEGWSWKYWNKIAESITRKYGFKNDSYVFLTGNMSPNEKYKAVYFNYWERSIIHQEPMWTFSDSKQSLFKKHRTSKFICLNRRPHPHRFAIVTQLHDIKDKGILTFGKEADSTIEHYNWKKQQFSHDYPRIYKQFKKSKIEASFPLIYNDGINAATDNPVVDKSVDKFYDSYLHVVCETFATVEPDRMFFSEKIFKPMLFFQPFVLIGQPGSLRALQNLGYKTFSPIIDERYDNEKNNEGRLIAAATAIKRFVDRPYSAIQEDFEALESIYFHNFGNLMSRICTLDIQLRQDLKKFIS